MMNDTFYQRIIRENSDKIEQLENRIKILEEKLNY